MESNSLPAQPSCDGLVDVRPVATVTPYLGGKRFLAPTIIPLIDRTPHTSYAEAFVGGGGIFLKRRRRPKAEAINDISGDVTTLFRVLQEHYPYFIDMLRWRLTSRDEFERLRALPADRLTDLQRAARFLYLQRLSFGGRIDGRTFGVSAANPARFNVSKLEPMLADVHERLAAVVIERLPWDAFLDRYDREGALHYLDPPYAGCEGDYGPGVFAPADFARMAERLAGLSGSFIMSINDTPMIRETFAAFTLREVETTYSVATNTLGKGKRVRELLISNLSAEALA